MSSPVPDSQNSISFTEGPIDGVQIRPIDRFEDERGWLAELYRVDELSGREAPVMAYVSVTHPGIARGPHEHIDQADLFAFLGPGRFRIVLWDNRPKSPTHGHRTEALVGERNPCVVYVPNGVVHAYRCESKTPGWVINLPDRLYKGDGRSSEIDEIRHEADPNSPFQLPAMPDP